MNTNKFILSAVIFFLSYISAYSQTTVNSYNGVDTVWTKAKSPYLVTGRITVPAGRSLTLEPGTVVFFKGNYAIATAEGTLNFNGTPTDKIILQGDSMVTTGDSTKVFYVYWQGISVTKSYALPGPALDFSMRYCVIKNSDGVNTSENVKTLLDHCEFYKNGQCFSAFPSSSQETDSIANCTISDNTAVFGYILNEKTCIVNSDIHNNDFLIYNPGRTFASISNSRIANTGIMQFSVRNITGSLFENLYCRQTPPRNCNNPVIVSADNISSSVFKNATISSQYKLFLRKNMSNTTMEGFGNAVETSAPALDTVRINHCTFTNNTTALTLNSQNNNRNIITCNRIYNNATGIICKSSQMDSIKNNMICNVTYNVYNAGSVTQNLTQNCLCGLNKAEIEPKLYDIADNAASGAINYNIYDFNCRALTEVVAKDKSVLTHADTTSEVDLGCINNSTSGLYIEFTTPDTICVQINTPYSRIAPNVRSDKYDRSQLSLILMNPNEVNTGMAGMYTEVWQAQDPMGNIVNKPRYIRVAANCDSLSSVADLSLSGFKVGPNPANTFIQVFVPEENNASTMSISLIAMDGRAVYQSEQAKTNVLIDTKALPVGIYSLLIVSDKQVFSRKIAVQR